MTYSSCAPAPAPLLCSLLPSLPEEETRLDDLLSDPMLRCLLRSDGVGLDDLRTLLNSIRQKLFP